MVVDEATDDQVEESKSEDPVDVDDSSTVNDDVEEP